MTDSRAYHSSEHCKRFVAEKVRRLCGLSFMRVPPGQWTATQRAQFDAWYPGDVVVAEEMLADSRFPAVLDRLGIVASPP